MADVRKHLEQFSQHHLLDHEKNISTKQKKFLLEEIEKLDFVYLQGNGYVHVCCISFVCSSLFSKWL